MKDSAVVRMYAGMEKMGKGKSYAKSGPVVKWATTKGPGAKWAQKKWKM